tara:strand:+ start:226 stop:699 length:474 start_codon:yes stop_codon:yes gene_type:complete
MTAATQLALLLVPCSAFVISVPTSGRSTATALRVSFSVKAAEAGGFTEEELAALQAASVSLEACSDKMNPFGKPETFFANIRSPDGVPNEAGRVPDLMDRDPDAATWDAVRSTWDVLASRSDDELNDAVRPIRAQKVSLDEAKNLAGGEKKGFFGLF